MHRGLHERSHLSRPPVFLRHDGIIKDAERPKSRSHAFIGGKFQEVKMHRTDEYGSLKPDQVLLIKDFILDDRQGMDSH